jgi:hypothetical protein
MIDADFKEMIIKAYRETIKLWGRVFLLPFFNIKCPGVKKLLAFYFLSSMFSG